MMANQGMSALKRALVMVPVFAVVAVLTVGGLPILIRLFDAGWISADWYHPAFAALCIVPAFAAHVTASQAGARGAGWWLVWVPGIAVYAAFPWQDGGTWRALWIFGYAWDWVGTIIGQYDNAGPFVFNAFGAFAAMLVVSGVTIGRLWFGVAGALGRSVRSGDEDAALPSATWASRRDVMKRFSAPGGIVLGELTDPVKESPRFSPERKRSWGRQGRGKLITMSPTAGNGHVLVTSQAAAYKSSGLVIPNILTYKGPLVVFDPKCELYARTRHARVKMGYTPVVIDARNGFDPARLIAAIAVDHPSAYRRMAKTVIPAGHSGIENSQYFKDAAVNLLSALLAYHSEIGATNILQDIAHMLSQSPDEIHEDVEEVIEESELEFVRNELGALQGMDAKFWYSVKTEITNQLMFGSMPDVQRYITMKPDSKLPSQVIDPAHDIFLNIPQNIAEDFAPMLRLMLGAMLTAAQFVEVNEAPRARRLFLIDEAAKLGNMDILENIRDRGRSLGLHLMMFYQTPGEIERLWGKAGMTSWRDGCSATIMGPVTSRNSAQEVSAMIGTRTLRVRTQSTSSSSQVTSPMAGSVSTTDQEQLRDVPLISPTAISQLPRHASVITSPGNKPILATKAIWFTRADMRERVRSTKEIEGELDVTGTQKKVTKRLAEMTQESGETDNWSSRPRAELAAMQRRDMNGGPEQADWAGFARPDISDRKGAGRPSLSELARPQGPRRVRPGDGAKKAPAASRGSVAERQVAPGTVPGEEGAGSDGPTVEMPMDAESVWNAKARPQAGATLAREAMSGPDVSERQSSPTGSALDDGRLQEAATAAEAKEKNLSRPDASDDSEIAVPAAPVDQGPAQAMGGNAGTSGDAPESIATAPEGNESTSEEQRPQDGEDELGHRNAEPEKASIPAGLGDDDQVAAETSGSAVESHKDATAEAAANGHDPATSGEADDQYEDVYAQAGTETVPRSEGQREEAALKAAPSIGDSLPEQRGQIGDNRASEGVEDNQPEPVTADVSASDVAVSERVGSEREGRHLDRRDVESGQPEVDPGNAKAAACKVGQEPVQALQEAPPRASAVTALDRADVPASISAAPDGDERETHVLPREHGADEPWQPNTAAEAARASAATCDEGEEPAKASAASAEERGNTMTTPAAPSAEDDRAAATAAVGDGQQGGSSDARTATVSRTGDQGDEAGATPSPPAPDRRPTQREDKDRDQEPGDVKANQPKRLRSDAAASVAQELESRQVVGSEPGILAAERAKVSAAPRNDGQEPDAAPPRVPSENEPASADRRNAAAVDGGTAATASAAEGHVTATVGDAGDASWGGPAQAGTPTNSRTGEPGDGAAPTASPSVSDRAASERVATEVDQEGDDVEESISEQATTRVASVVRSDAAASARSDRDATAIADSTGERTTPGEHEGVESALSESGRHDASARDRAEANAEGRSEPSAELHVSQMNELHSHDGGSAQPDRESSRDTKGTADKAPAPEAEAEDGHEGGVLERSLASQASAEDGRVGDVWTPEERARFMDLVHEETPLEEIAEDLGRSLASVEAWNGRQRARGLVPYGVRDGTGETDDGGTDNDVPGRSA